MSQEATALHWGGPQRADVALQALGLCSSRSQAQACIAQQQVQVQHRGQWLPVAKPAHTIHMGDTLRLRQADPHTGLALPQYVSRGGLKLHHALAQLGWSVAGLHCVDIGQSTGGFTDCLLQHGASTVVGFDVGHGQLHRSLHGHPQVVALQGIAVHTSTADELRVHLQHPVDLLVMDVSFISALKVLPVATALLSNHRSPQPSQTQAKPKPSRALVLIKPQFELGPAHLNKKGVVKNPDTQWPALKAKVEAACQALGWQTSHFLPCALQGGEGNQEYFVALQGLDHTKLYPTSP